jgi:hypothetical protein
MTLESTLSFLEGHVTLYYAGIDSDSLPFTEGYRLVRKSASAQISYLKTLALVADYIVVPPSFYFFWADTHHDQTLFRLLLELYKAGIVVSPIYTTMNLGTDFLDQKTLQGSSFDRLLIQKNKDILVTFFREMPVIHRDVRRQSGGYRDLFSRELTLLPAAPNLRLEIESFVLAPKQSDILLSREQLHAFLAGKYHAAQMSRKDFRQCFYATNRAYYQQGAFTYDAAISLLGAERYSILGEEAFRSPCGVLIAYDPLVVLGILEHFGVTRELIARLSTEDLLTIRKTAAFCAFRDAYHQFAITLQEIAIQTRHLSKSVVVAAKHSIQTEALSWFFREDRLYSNRQRVWNIGEMTLFAVALGITGFLVIPLIGALLGALPILVYSFRLTPRLSDFVISRLSERQLPFCVFVRELQGIVDRIKTQQQGAGDVLPSCP